MKLRTLAAAALVAAATPSIAGAAVVYSSLPYNFGLSTGATITFDTALPMGYSLSPDAIIQSGSNGNGAAPATSMITVDTTQYLTSVGAARLTGTTLYNFVSLYWGSIDSYNTLQLYDGSNLVGQILGTDINLLANGDQVQPTTNRFVTVSSDVAFNSLVFLTSQPAFEVDNISFLTSVPEPATWLSMIAGFGMIGAGLRRRRNVAVTFA